MSSSNSPCAACKFLRRKCTQGCVFAPYFPPDQPQKFANVHRVFGASNVAKLLNDLSPAHREDAVNSLAYEAEARIHDPVYGCVAHIQYLQQRLRQMHIDLYAAKKELASYIGPAALGPMLPPQHSPFGMAAVSFHQQQVAGSMAQYGMNVGLGLTPGANQQMLLREQQQQIEAQQLAAVAAAAAREQEMFRNMEAQQQQQNEINARFGNNSGFVDGRAFNNNNNNNNSVSVVQVASAAAGGTSPPSGLALVSPQQFDNSSFHIQQQQQQIQMHHPYAEHHRMQQHQRSGSDEGRSGAIGPASS